jgi:hypothetical protein
LPPWEAFVTQRLILTNTYFVGSPRKATVTVQDTDPFTDPVAVATLNAPAGIDYHTNSNSLIVSVNHTNGVPNNFERIAANGATSVWFSVSGIGYLDVEIKLATVKSSISNWTQGDMYNLGLSEAEDVRLIPSGQNLYCLDFGFNRVLKVPASHFAAFAGDILFVNEADCPPALFIVHWDGGRFVVRQITVPANGLEHVTFPPINIPALP